MEKIFPTIEIDLVASGLNKVIANMKLVLDAMSDEFEDNERISEYVDALYLAADRVFEEKNKLDDISDAILEMRKKEKC